MTHQDVLSHRPRYSHSAIFNSHTVLISNEVTLKTDAQVLLSHCNSARCRAESSRRHINVDEKKVIKKSYL